MFEVEAKVHLSKADLKRVQKQVSKIAKLKGKTIKKDQYYGDAKGFFLRIRKKDKRIILNLKQKKVEQGIEVNQEVEFELKPDTTFGKLLEKLGIKKGPYKEKISTVYTHENIQIELNHIKRLGDFLEIEIIAQSKKDIPSAKKRLHQIFKEFGFSPKEFEKRYYVQLLQETDKTK